MDNEIAMIQALTDFLELHVDEFPQHLRKNARELIEDGKSYESETLDDLLADDWE